MRTFKSKTGSGIFVAGFVFIYICNKKYIFVGSTNLNVIEIRFKKNSAKVDLKLFIEETLK